MKNLRMLIRYIYLFDETEFKPIAIVEKTFYGYKKMLSLCLYKKNLV